MSLPFPIWHMLNKEKNEWRGGERTKQSCLGTGMGMVVSELSLLELISCLVKLTTYNLITVKYLRTPRMLSCKWCRSFYFIMIYCVAF